MISTNTL